MKISSSISNNKNIYLSLAEWSLHKAIHSGEIKNIDFPRIARNDFGIGAVEYVSQLFEDRSLAENTAYLLRLKDECERYNVESRLIMIDLEGDLGHLNANKRIEAVENHYKWIRAANFLGCKAVRVNAYGEGTPEQVQLAFIDGLGKLCDFAIDFNIDVIVENHGGYSSNPDWVISVVKAVDRINCGLLPDFGNFPPEVDRYQAIRNMIPYAKGLSAKSTEFDSNGNEVNIDYMKMFQIVEESNYEGYIGVEYEGNRLSEYDGINATIKLIKNYCR